jgi:hypothetical protein
LALHCTADDNPGFTMSSSPLKLLCTDHHQFSASEYQTALRTSLQA